MGHQRSIGWISDAVAGVAEGKTPKWWWYAFIPSFLCMMMLFGLITYLIGNAKFAQYLQVHYVAGTGELAVICGALIGAGLGFLWFNAPPAMIFMGDTGSLSLGGALGAIAVAVKHEIVLAIVGAGNAVNLTDGLDGLAIVPVIIAAASFGVIVYCVGNVGFAEYLQLHYVRGSGELAVLCGAIIGAGLGFLWFNAPPAMIFMGDTGSLSLGGALGAIAVAVKHEIVLAVVGGLFVLETVSVMVQVVSFKLTGKRVFAMAPLHHHFEQKGWREPTIVIRFWIIAVVLALVGLSTLKLR